MKGRILDKDDGASTYDGTVVVENVAPMVGEIAAPPDPVAVNTTVNAGASFTDQGPLDTHTASWDWGDGASSPGAVTESGGSGKGAAFTRTKFKNLLTGAVVERNIRSGEKLEPANVETRDMQFLYKEADGLVFMDQSNYEQVTIPTDMVGGAHDLMKDNLPCTVVFFNERPVDVTLPTFVILEVTASEPGVKGDTASGGGNKPATLETGATVNVPLFVNIGDRIKVDTRSGSYMSRA